MVAATPGIRSPSIPAELQLYGGHSRLLSDAAGRL
jgi:hypothetical protein